MAAARDRHESEQRGGPQRRARGKERAARLERHGRPGNDQCLTRDENHEPCGDEIEVLAKTVNRQHRRADDEQRAIEPPRNTAQRGRGSKAAGQAKQCAEDEADGGNRGRSFGHRFSQEDRAPADSSWRAAGGRARIEPKRGPYDDR